MTVNTILLIYFSIGWGVGIISQLITDKYIRVDDLVYIIIGCGTLWPVGIVIFFMEKFGHVKLINLEKKK